MRLVVNDDTRLKPKMIMIMMEEPGRVMVPVDGSMVMMVVHT